MEKIVKSTFPSLSLGEECHVTDCGNPRHDIDSASSKELFVDYKF
uniref:Uncharacterized protein n=1 Tax=Setaria italica TaxID=4555 RepID=K3ZPA2_SETIT